MRWKVLLGDGCDGEDVQDKPAGFFFSARIFEDYVSMSPN
jgi:hypothetical protein